MLSTKFDYVGKFCLYRQIVGRPTTRNFEKVSGKLRVWAAGVSTKFARSFDRQIGVLSRSLLEVSAAAAAAVVVARSTPLMRRPHQRNKKVTNNKNNNKKKLKR